MNGRSVYLADRPLDAGRSHYCWSVMNTTACGGSRVVRCDPFISIESDRKRRKSKSGSYREIPAIPGKIADQAKRAFSRQGRPSVVAQRFPVRHIYDKINSGMSIFPRIWPPFASRMSGH